VSVGAGGGELGRDHCLLFIGNSMSGSPGGAVAPYPERLAPLLPSAWRVTTIIRSGATIEEMESEIITALAARPAAVVLQVGINECAPRPLGAAGRRRLGRLRPVWLRNRIIGVLHRWRPEIIRRRSLAQMTPLDRFQASVGRVTDAARRAGSRMMILPITEVTDAAERRTPFTNREVARYNRVLQALAGDGVTWVDTPTLLPGLTPAAYCWSPETVHWNEAAHERIARFLYGWIAPADEAPAR
jgi:lysophospholipase L1-like esterase